MLLYQRSRCSRSNTKLSPIQVWQMGSVVAAKTDICRLGDTLESISATLMASVAMIEGQGQRGRSKGRLSKDTDLGAAQNAAEKTSPMSGLQCSASRVRVGVRLDYSLPLNTSCRCNTTIFHRLHEYVYDLRAIGSTCNDGDWLYRLCHRRVPLSFGINSHQNVVIIGICTVKMLSSIVKEHAFCTQCKCARITLVPTASGSRGNQSLSTSVLTTSPLA